MVEPPKNASLVWQGSTPYAEAFGDLYYSADDPMGEVRHTFLNGTNFSELIRRPHLCIAETGFGTGLNFLSAWAEWDRAKLHGQSLNFVSVEAFPLNRNDLERAHQPFVGLENKASALREQWPGAIPGCHRLVFDGGRVRLILLIGEAAELLSTMKFQADAWFLDGFAPAKNPEMWRPAVLEEVARLSKPSAVIATFTAAGAVRRGLEAVGFEMQKRPGFGRKRDCLSGILKRPRPPLPHHWSDPTPVPLPGRIAIVGDGVAARAAANALVAAGLHPIQIGGGDSSAYAASTLPRALIAPKLVRGDEPFPRFWRQSFLDAVRFIDATVPDCWVGDRGLLIPPTEKTGLDWQRKLLDSLDWPNDQLFGSEKGLYLPKAGALDPTMLLNALSPPPEIQADVGSLTREKTSWSLKSESGRTLAEADLVILANGPGATALLPPPRDGYGLRIGSGHLRMMRAAVGAAPNHAVLMNGYRTAADEDGVFAVGASVTPRQPLGPVSLPLGKDEELAQRTAPLSGDAHRETIWTGLRCDTVDHLPILGLVQDPEKFNSAYASLRNGKALSETHDGSAYQKGLYGFTGLGARGFQGAFLLADTLAALITGAPLALSEDIRRALAPARFQARAMIKNIG